MATPIGIPDEWEDNNLILFEEFCDIIRTPQRTVRDWRSRGAGPRWTRFQGVGRLYVTVAKARRFLVSATVSRAEVRSDGCGTRHPGPPLRQAGHPDQAR